MAAACAGKMVSTGVVLANSAWMLFSVPDFMEKRKISVAFSKGMKYNQEKIQMRFYYAISEKTGALLSPLHP